MRAVAKALNPLNKGFTLLELITVLVVIGVLATVAVSRFVGKQGFAEVAWQQRVISALRNVQQRAMQDTRSGICQQLVIDSSNNQYGLPAIATPCASTIDFSHMPLLSSGSDGLTADNVSIQASNTGVGNLTLIGFNGLGQPVDASNNRICSSNCTVTISGSENAQVVIESEGYIHGL